MLLKDLANYLIASEISGDEYVDCQGICFDSRQVNPGDLFLWLPGHPVAGHQYAKQAAEQGASALVVQRFLEEVPLQQLKVKDSRLAMAVLGNVFFDYPSNHLKAIV